MLQAASDKTDYPLPFMDAEAVDAPAQQELLVFTLGGEEYGIHILSVQELRGYEKVTGIANAPDFVKGVINLRGVVVPIIDVRVKFNLENPTYDLFTVVVVLDVGGTTIGMVVDSVSDVIVLRRDQIKPPPKMETFAGSDYLTGLGIVDDRMIILADIEKLMSGLGVRPSKLLS